MFYHGNYKIENGKVVYEPVAGPTIKEVINNAIEISRTEKKPVELHINDIILDVNQNSDPTNIAVKYFSKLERKYRQSYSATYHKNIHR